MEDISERNRWLHWLIREVERNQAYHNQKETVAWAATALYVPGIIVAGYQMQELSYERWQLLLPLLLLTAAVICFVSFQFYWRWIASDRAEGLIRAIAKLQHGNWHPTPDNCVIEKGEYYPKFIEDEIKSIRQPHIKAQFKRRRWQVEWSSYLAIVVSTLAAIVLILH